MNDPIQAYLEALHEIRAPRLATNERSYYPALAALFKAYGDQLMPRVTAIHDVADRGAGHPDFLLVVTDTHDPRAAVEVKGTGDEVDSILRSEQAKRYLTHYDVLLVTNLRDFALARRGPDGMPEPIMRHTLAADERTFWATSPATLAAQQRQRFADFLLNVLTWDAQITRPKDLAEALARYAREALRRLEHASAESLAPLRKALSEALGLHFTDAEGEHFFRSSLVQTLFYGMFSAWAVWNAEPHRGSFTWRAAGDYLHLPVLRELFEHVAIGSQLERLDIRQPLEWAEATLDRTLWGAFSAAFDNGDAVNYFYEPFLEAYDPQLREQLGVWYTPREIIRYQVARVDRLLRDEFAMPAGLADDRVIVLDPAAGTGGYLLETLRVIDETLRERGEGALRGMKLREAATRRVFGFEILPAPFVVAHLQIATLLAGRGAALGARDRAGMYLTNALTGWGRNDVVQSTLEGWPELKHEAEAAAGVKREARILVVLGNPPYYAYAGTAEDEEHDLIAPYYVGLAERFGVQARSINDLYVRFFRLAERQIAEKTGQGIVCYISNYSWLSGLSHPVMREHMLNAFDDIWIDNLHGDRIISERTPNGNSCETIFAVRGQSAGIKVGTAITTLLRHGTGTADSTRIRYRDVWGMPDDAATWGRAERKRQALLWSSELPREELDALYQPIAPTAATRFTLKPGGTNEAYMAWLSLDKLFVRQFPGVKTSRDADLVSIDREPLERRMRAYFDPSLSDSQVAEYAPVLMQNASRYDAAATRRELLAKSGYRDDRIVRVAYRPLDDRWLYWEGATKLLDEKRTEFFEQVFARNLFLEALIRQRRSGLFDHGAVVSTFMDVNYVDGSARCFPLYYRQADSLFAGISPNFQDYLLSAISATYEVPQLPERLFFHIAAILNSPAYRVENAGSIERDWPRIPIPATREPLEASATLGRRVADLLRPDVPFDPMPEMRALGIPTKADGSQLAPDDLTVTVRYAGVGRYEPPVDGGHRGRLWWNDRAYWDNVPPEVWSFTIGGYPVVKKWLDYRHVEKLKRPLRAEEVAYVSEMIRRIATLLALGPALDENYAAIKSNTLDVRPRP